MSLKTSPIAQAASSEVARHIASAAARLFATRGYDATSVRDIVEAAEVTKPTLYYYFGSKQGLAEALLTVPMTQLLETLERIVAAEIAPLNKVAQVLEAHFAFCREDADRARFMYALFFGPAGTALSTELAEYGEALHQLMKRVIEELANAGVIVAGSRERTLAALRGLVTIHTMDYLYRDVALGPELAMQLANDLVRGFGIAGPVVTSRRTKKEAGI